MNKLTRITLASGAALALAAGCGGESDTAPHPDKVIECPGAEHLGQMRALGGEVLRLYNDGPKPAQTEAPGANRRTVRYNLGAATITLSAVVFGKPNPAPGAQPQIDMFWADVINGDVVYSSSFYDGSGGADTCDGSLNEPGVTVNVSQYTHNVKGPTTHNFNVTVTDATTENNFKVVETGGAKLADCTTRTALAHAQALLNSARSGQAPKLPIQNPVTTCQNQATPGGTFLPHPTE